MIKEVAISRHTDEVSLASAAPHRLPGRPGRGAGRIHEYDSVDRPHGRTGCHLLLCGCSRGNGEHGQCADGRTAGPDRAGGRERFGRSVSPDRRAQNPGVVRRAPDRPLLRGWRKRRRSLLIAGLHQSAARHRQPGRAAGPPADISDLFLRRTAAFTSTLRRRQDAGAEGAGDRYADGHDRGSRRQSDIPAAGFTPIKAAAPCPWLPSTPT